MRRSSVDFIGMLLCVPMDVVNKIVDVVDVIEIFAYEESVKHF